jgi:hypothetical protein
MADPLLGDQDVTAERDADTGEWLVQGWRAGPAGSAPVRLADGVEVDLDVADAGVLTGLTVPAEPTPRATRVVTALLGDDRAADLLALEPGPKVVRLRGPAASPRDGSVTDRRLVQLSLAAVTSAEATHDVVRAVALLEAAVAAGRLGPGLGLGRGARADAAAGLRILLAAPAPPLDDDDMGRLDALVRAARRLLPADDPLRHASPPGPAHVAAAAMAMPADMPFAMAEQAAPAPAPVRRLLPTPPLLDPLPQGLDHADVRVHRTAHSEIEVEIDDVDAAELWARAVSRDVLVALAPFRTTAGTAVSRLLVPPEAVDLHVELVDDAAAPVRSEARRAAELGLRLGRAAARADRLGKGRFREGRSRWERSAAAWAEAGDDARAASARDRSMGLNRRRRTAPPLTADGLAERLEPPA